MTPLQVGSVEARALHGLYAGKRLVTVESCPDFLWAACRVINRLMDEDRLLRVVFLADTTRDRDRLCLRLRYRADRFLAPHRMEVTRRHQLMGRRTTRKPIRVTSTSDRDGIFCELLVVDPQYVTVPDTIEQVSDVAQLLLLGTPTPTVQRACEALITATGDNRPEWGEMPIDVALAGAPQ